jgi:regulator of sigma E protease
MMSELSTILLLVFGFGFVIFWHELGHFLAAKWVGIRVEQFAVGFGQALLSWRKGLGVKFGSSGAQYDELAAKGEAGNIGETEYRLNWIPLGGYVKMLGQDDLRPNSEQDDPRAYNKKSIGARMLVVSAGVIMNILLAVIGFTILFRMGFRVQPPVVGSIIPNSPAALAVRASDGKAAPLQVGDRILMFDDKWQHDFTKITLNVALAGSGPVPTYVRRVDGTEELLSVSPQRASKDSSGFLMIGVGPAAELRGFDKKDQDSLLDNKPLELVGPDALKVKPGETITHVNGEKAALDEFWKLDRAIQASDGNPVKFTVLSDDGKSREETITPTFLPPFGESRLNFAGMLPRATIEVIDPRSPARGKLYPGDVVLEIESAGPEKAKLVNPTMEDVRERLKAAGASGAKVNMRVLRGDKEIAVNDLTPNAKIDRGVYGLNVQLAADAAHPIVAATSEASEAREAGIPQHSTITAINGQPVKSWYDVKRLLAGAPTDKPATVTAQTPTGQQDFTLNLKPERLAEIAGMRYAQPLFLHEKIEPRMTRSPWIAAAWGVTETRDFVLQFYLTLHRMFTGSVSYKNMMGPVGIFNAGRQFAYKGNDWLIWFLAMISANLAVVNFLPIPIVDGGLFTFLILEKIQGKPLSAKTQSIAQVVGLAIILSVFLLVTYQDIARLLS